MLRLPDGISALPVRPRRRADADREGPRQGVEGDVRRLPGARAGSRPSTPCATTPSTSTASRGSTACAPSWPRAAIDLPEGSPDDPADADDRARPGTRKNDLVLRADPRRRRRGLRGLRALRPRRPRRRAADGGRLVERELRRTSWPPPGSRTCSRPSSTARRSRSEGLQGKPAPGHLPRGRPARSASSPRRRRSSRTRWPGSRPGAPGGFGYVVGVDRVGQADALRGPRRRRRRRRPRRAAGRRA